MKKLLLSMIILFSLFNCTKDDDCDGSKEAIVYRWPDKDYEFKMNFPYDCETGEPLLDYGIPSKIIFVRWAE